MKRIVIATDGWSCSRKALELGLELAAAEGAEVRVVHVVPRTEWATPAMLGAMARVPHRQSEADRASLVEARKLAEQRGQRVSTELLIGDVVNEVVTYADSFDADMIVVGSHGLGAVTGAIVGSVSQGILHEAACPVLIVPGERRAVPA
jgi:nucleotide-binding universal stress UspA family protein